MILFNTKKKYNDLEIIKTGIYKITNLINNKIYVGSAGGKNGFKQRWLIHKNTLKSGKHGNKHLQKAWDKHGENSFIFEIIEFVQDTNIILVREQYYFDLLKPYINKIGYNISKIAGSNLGYNQTFEAKQKISEFNKGKILSEETRKKMSDSKIGVLAGEKHPIAKFTNIEVKEIRDFFKNGLSYLQLSEKYKVSKQTICGIILNKTYVDKNYIPIKIDYSGSKKINAKLTDLQVSEIREKFKNNKISYTILANEFNISKTTVGEVIRYKTYKNIINHDKD